MNRIYVSSSYLHSVWYNEASMTLEIEFNSGGVYAYYDVPESIYNGLMNAPSHGKYFHQYIKDVYRFKRIR